MKEVAHDQAHDHTHMLTMCPFAHVPHPPRCPISIFSINHDTHLPTFPIAQMSKKEVKLSKRCQVVKKMSSCQKVKHMDYGGGSQKK